MISDLPLRLLFFSGLLFFSILAEGQTTLSGKVYDDSGRKPLPGALIHVKGTSDGTATDEEGNFKITTIQPVPLKLEVSSTGYETREVEVVDASQPIEVPLIIQVQGNEVVVIGYSSREKKTLTSAISKISSKEIANIPVASVDQQIQGKAAGVQVAANSSVPGTGTFIRVRGATSINASNDPLYVIDGIFVDNKSLQSLSAAGQLSNPLADISPADIESVEILKDANATSIYGARGANGVILITTKRGKLNSKPKVNFGYYYAVSKAPEFWKLVSGPEDAMLQNETWINDGGAYDQRPFRPKSEGGLGTPEEQGNYDRLGLIFHNAPTHNFDLSSSGGDENTTYYISGNYYTQEATVRPDKFERGSFRMNVDRNIHKKVKLGISSALVRTSRVLSANGWVPNGTINGALYTPAYYPIYNPDGSYARPVFYENPVATMNETDNSAIGTRVLGNIYGEYTILKGLKFRTTWSLDYGDNYENNYYNTRMFLGQPGGMAVSAYTRSQTWINEQTLSYNTTLGGDHSVTFLLGNTLQKNNIANTSVTGIGFPSNSFKTISASATQTGTSSRSASGLESYFARASYGYKNKYLAEGNIRADASSRFGKNNQWGFFPSVGVAWRAGQEKFIQNLNIFNELKFRGSIGLTGNQNGIPDFAAQGLWNGGANYMNNSGITPAQLANPDLSWETTRQWNLGTDIAVLKNRVNLEFNYYDKYTTGLLLNVPVPGKSGYSSIFENSGEMSNRGIEFAVNSTNIKTKSFSWFTSFNIARNVNRIEKLDNPLFFGSENRIKLQEGYSLYSYQAYKQLYVDPQTGDAVYEDVNKDGKITPADLQILGNAWPAYFGGLTNTFTFKGFDLTAFFNFSKGNQIWSQVRYFNEHGGTRNGGRAFLDSQLDRWQKPGDVTDVPRMSAKSPTSGLASSRFIEDGSYFRLKTLTLGYNFPEAGISRLKIATLRIYVSATNLFTITKYKGPDPEINASADDQNTRAFDQAIAPLSRTFQAGFNIGF
jgi:TonB-dependent starch-binding outer membrane protein SusC